MVALLQVYQEDLGQRFIVEKHTLPSDLRSGGDNYNISLSHLSFLFSSHLQYTFSQKRDASFKAAIHVFLFIHEISFQSICWYISCWQSGV